LSGEEWHHRDGAALGAGHLVHVPRWLSGPFSTARCSTRWATLRIIQKPLLLVEVLLADRENEGHPTIAARQRLVAAPRGGVDSSLFGHDR